MKASWVRKKKSWTAGSAQAIFLGAIALLLVIGAPVAGAPVLASDKPEAATIEVEADGEVLARPDRASLDFAVETQAADPKEAASANARASEQFQAEMKKLLGPEEKFKTSGYQVYPVFKYVEKTQGKEKVRTQELLGYKAEQRYRVQLADLSRIGKFIDAGMKNGATRVNGPYFEHSRRDELQQEAAALAFKRARNLAEALAQAAGVKIKGVRKISTTPSYRPLAAPMMAKARSAEGGEPETPIEVGEEKFQARIQAAFELAP